MNRRLLALHRDARRSASAWPAGPACRRGRCRPPPRLSCSRPGAPCATSPTCPARRIRRARKRTPWCARRLAGRMRELGLEVSIQPVPLSDKTHARLKAWGTPAIVATEAPTWSACCPAPTGRRRRSSDGSPRHGRRLARGGRRFGRRRRHPGDGAGAWPLDGAAARPDPAVHRRRGDQLRRGRRPSSPAIPWPPTSAR